MQNSKSRIQFRHIRDGEEKVPTKIWAPWTMQHQEESSPALRRLQMHHTIFLKRKLG